MNKFLEEGDRENMVKVMEVNRNIPVDKKALKLARKQYSATGVDYEAVHSGDTATLYREKLGEEKE